MSKGKCDIRSYYYRRAKLEFGEITACILYVRTETIYIYIARLIIEHPREWLASLADYDCSNTNVFYCVRYKLLGTYI